MKLIGKSGEQRFLVTMDGKIDGYARVIDLEQGVMFAPFRLQSILARGYWEPYEGTQAELDELLSQVKDEKIVLEPDRELHNADWLKRKTLS